MCVRNKLFNLIKKNVMVVDNTQINVNNVLIENVKGYVHTWGNTTASRKRTRTKRYNEKSWQAGRHTPNTTGQLKHINGAETWTFTK